MDYHTLKETQQHEFDSFPIMFAFSQAQLAAELRRLGCTAADLVKTGGGGFVRREDLPALQEMIDRHTAEMVEAYRDETFLVSALKYELSNHEYPITCDPSEALDALGIPEDLSKTPRIQALLERACSEVMSECIW